MHRIKIYLQHWLGIEQLANYVVLTRKELGLAEGISIVTDITTGQTEPVDTPEGKEIIKGYDKP